MSLARQSLRAGFSSLKLCLELGAGSFVYGRKLTNKNCRQRLIKSNIFFFAKGIFFGSENHLYCQHWWTDVSVESKIKIWCYRTVEPWYNEGPTEWKNYVRYNEVSLYRVSFPWHFAITGVKNIVCYTEDFVIWRLTIYWKYLSRPIIVSHSSGSYRPISIKVAWSMFHSPRCIIVASLVNYVPATSLET